MNPATINPNTAASHTKLISPSLSEFGDLADARAIAFEARWTGAGLDALHRERFTLTPTSASPGGAVQAKLAAMRPGYIVALIGPRGTGKTQIAQNLIGGMLHAWTGETFDRINFRRTPRYTSAAKLFRAMRDAQKRGREDDGLNETNAIASFVNPPMIVIDEAHERGETDFENRTLNEIIDDRYAARRSTLLVSNLSKSDFSKSIGPSVISRIFECGEVIECTWKSFREKKEPHDDRQRA